jgi:hypothetical protein
MRASALSAIAFLAIGVSACGGEASDDPLGTAVQTQLDPGWRDYVLYMVTDASGAQVAQVLVTATAGAGFDADREYWFVTTNLGDSGTYTFTGGASESWSNPPSGLGTLSFTMKRTPTWTPNTLSGTILGYSNALTGEFDGINWGMENSNGSWTGGMTWWHNSTGNLFGPGVTRTLGPTFFRNKAGFFSYAASPL